MNCNEVKEHITSAVDGRLEPHIKHEFEEHVLQCSLCRSEFELERLTKRYVQTTLPRPKTPSALSANIINQLGSLHERDQQSWLT